jgi:hypothetical protein
VPALGTAERTVVRTEQQTPTRDEQQLVTPVWNALERWPSGYPV